MLLSIVIIIVGFVLLIAGANWLVSGSSALAKRHGVSDIIVGLTIVAFGTSAPELIVNSISSWNGLSDLVYGNVIGSNNFNLFIILGVVGIIMPIHVGENTVWKEIPTSFGVALAALILSRESLLQDGLVLSRAEGITLMMLFLLFLSYVFRQLKKENASEKAVETESSVQQSYLIPMLIIGGLTALIVGGKLVVDNAVLLATYLGISNKVIGLTVVAAGTSLPELVTSVVAALQKKSDIAIGNVIGSNIFNILLVLGGSAVIHPIVYNLSFGTDFYIFLGGTAFLFAAMFMSGKKKLDRWEAALLISFYLCYTAWQLLFEH